MKHVDRSNDILELEKLNKKEELEYTQMNQKIVSTHDDLIETQKNLHFLEGNIRNEEMDARRLNERLRNRIVLLQQYRQEQDLFERQEQIEEIVGQHPTFLELIEAHYKSIKSNQDAGRVLPLEGSVDPDDFVDKLNKMETTDYLITYGIDKAYETFSNYKENYSRMVQRLAEEHVDGITAQAFTYDDFLPILNAFTKNQHIRQYLGR